MATEFGPASNLARVKHLSADGRTIFLEFPNGQVGTVSGDFDFEIEVGTVLFVRPADSYVGLAPPELWLEDRWVGIVRLKTDDVTIVDTNGRWRRLPTSAVMYQEGYTVEGCDSKGVTSVLSERPLKYFDLPALDDAAIASFIVERGPTEEAFEDFGGSREAVGRARELIEVSLNEYERIARIGTRPVKGVLFTGPPGVGKTMLARIIANTTDSTFYEIRGPEVMSKWYGQSEELLRLLFDHAATQQRAIIFFDEIDSIAAHRGGDAHEVSRRVVAQLLSLMDGFDAASKVVVIAATNRPQDIDVALRRPGRFDWEIAFPLPDLEGREAILRKGARTLQTAEELLHSELARKTDGWSGAELAAIWTEAGLLAAMDKREQITDEDYFGGYERVLRNRKSIAAVA